MWTVREYIYIYSSLSLSLYLSLHSLSNVIRLRFIIVRDGHSVILLPVQLGPSGKDQSRHFVYTLNGAALAAAVVNAAVVLL